MTHFVHSDWPTWLVSSLNYAVKIEIVGIWSWGTENCHKKLFERCHIMCFSSAWAHVQVKVLNFTQNSIHICQKKFEAKLLARELESHEKQMSRKCFAHCCLRNFLQSLKGEWQMVSFIWSPATFLTVPTCADLWKRT
jgi:hypothetical protein